MSALLSRRQRILALKFIGVLTMVRWYNILAVAVAQYLASIYILNPNDPKIELLLDYKLHLITISSAALIAAGYIINSFYDMEKDLVNRPNQNVFDRLVSKESSLAFYFILNGAGVVLAILVSKEVALLHFILSLVLWFYSHKLKKIPIIAEVSAASLTLTPFFSITIYYGVINKMIILYVAFFFLVELTRQLMKALETSKGDLIFDYNTFPVTFGERATKWTALFIFLSGIVPAVMLYISLGLNLANIYHGFALVIGTAALISVFPTQEISRYRMANNALKLILIAGVLAITLIRYQ